MGGSEDEDLVDIKFRLYDGSDIGPFRYSTASTIDILKQRLVSDWPQGKSMAPKAAAEIKLITSGQILLNTKTVGQCRTNFTRADLIIMHVVVQPSSSTNKTENKEEDIPRKTLCSCSIL
uniref:Membrane-anchored ubiquitin-fold protein n=1 Tax=Kalanchoe fedtschenkoi TaxID=63787 RepID=A0A7N0VDR0_KALFE